MNWADIGGKLARVGAPIIGTALGGPLGGTIGGVLGNIVANAIGADEATPEAVDAKINSTDPEVLKAQLASADAEASAKWNAIMEIAKAEAADRTAQSEAINQTIQFEAGKVSWWHWRHLIGYLVIAYGLQQIALTNIVTFGWSKVTMEQLAQQFNSQAVFTAGLFALLGYIAQDTTKRQVAAATGQPMPPNIVSTIKQAILPKKK